MKILVTGGAGFIGNALVTKLVDEGHQVTSFDRTKHVRPREYVNEVYGDIQDSFAVDCYVRDHDYTFNIAGMLGTAETVENPIPACNINIIGALNVFNACKRHRKGATHITVGNYWMNNPYSITKSTSERFALMYNKEHGTQISIVRGLNVYGPGQKAFPVRKLMPNLILSALQDEDIIIYGSGKQQMDMIYITDAINCLYQTMVIDHGVYDSIFDVGMGIAPSVNDIAREVIRQVPRTESKIIHEPMRAGEEDISVVVGNANTLKVLDICPKDFLSLEEGIAKAIPYYRGD